MIISKEVFVAMGLVVLVASLLALLLKVALFALVADQWFGLRHALDHNSEKAVAQDEYWSAILRICGVLLSLIVGVTWVIVAITLTRQFFEATGLIFVIAFTSIGHAVLADAQGIRSLFFRRRMARLFSSPRLARGTLTTVDELHED